MRETTTVPPTGEVKKALEDARARIDARRKEVWGNTVDIWSIESDALCIWQGLSEAIRELDEMIEPGKHERELRHALKELTRSSDRPKSPTNQEHGEG
jgi:hypothetical protein